MFDVLKHLTPGHCLSSGLYMTNVTQFMNITNMLIRSNHVQQCLGFKNTDLSTNEGKHLYQLKMAYKVFMTNL